MRENWKIRTERPEWALVLFVLPLSLDFRGKEVGGGVWQFSLVAITLFMFALSLATRRVSKLQGRESKSTALLLGLAIAGSALCFLVNEIPIDRYVRVVLPLLLLFFGYFQGASMVIKRRSKSLGLLLYLGAAVSTIFTVFVGAADGDLESIRYQIVSPVLLVLQGILLLSIVSGKSKKWLPLTALIATVVIQVLSVTRSSILGSLVVFVGVGWLMSDTRRQFAKFSSRTALIIGGVIFGLGVASQIYPQVIERWMGRINAGEVAGLDPTTLTRIAEATDQLDEWRSSVLTIAIGKGYGAEYEWSSAYQRDLIATGALRADQVNLRYSEAGHNFWVNSIFTGGLAFGWILPGVILMALLRSFQIRKNGVLLDSAEYDLLLRSAVVLIAWVAFTIGGNPIGSRFFSLLGGLAVGVIFALSGFVSRRRRSRDALMRGHVGAGFASRFSA